MKSTNIKNSSHYESRFSVMTQSAGLLRSYSLTRNNKRSGNTQRKLARIVSIGLLLLIITACSATPEANYKIVSFDTSLTCDHCKTTMFNNLPKEKGVVDLKVSVEEKTVTILFDENETTVEKLAEKIYSLGYSAYVIEIKNYDGNFN